LRSHAEPSVDAASTFSFAGTALQIQKEAPLLAGLLLHLLRRSASTRERADVALIALLSIILNGRTWNH